MRIRLDRSLFTRTDLDSASLTALGSVVHQFSEPGRYRGVVLRGGEAVGTFSLSVDRESTATEAAIDLAAVAEDATGSGDAPSGTTFEVHPEGYVVFHVSRGDAGYAVHVGRLDEGPKPKTFDSREMK